MSELAPQYTPAVHKVILETRGFWLDCGVSFGRTTSGLTSWPLTEQEYVRFGPGEQGPGHVIDVR